MTRRYIAKARDSFRKIAELTYRDVSLAGALAGYNGYRNARALPRGAVIELPARRELAAPRVIRRAGLVSPPHGLAAIIETFGDLQRFIRPDGTLDPRWEMQNMVSAPLPFPIPLSWDVSVHAKRIRCHKKAADAFVRAFTAIQEAGLRGKITAYGGAYTFRPKRSSTKLSTHSWGIAVDLNPATNGMGRAGDMDPRVVEIFREHGFKWGGDWPGRGKDPMHFQFCTGY